MAKVALVDADVYCYLACPPRHAVAAFNVVDLEVPEEEAAEIEEDAYRELCMENLKKSFDKVEKDFGTVLAAVKSGGHGFRAELFTGYKSSRANYNPELKNITVPWLREELVRRGMAEPSGDLEADDLIRIWATEADKFGHDRTICSIDKDLRCIPGKHYNPKKRELSIVGELEALKLYYEQLLKGDPTDDIPGLPGIGPVKAAQMIEACQNEDSMQRVVVGAYIAQYGDKWFDYLLMNGKLIHLLRSLDDYFVLTDWEVTWDLL